jgi:diacylglycerol kinase (ATP)
MNPEVVLIANSAAGRGRSRGMALRAQAQLRALGVLASVELPDTPLATLECARTAVGAKARALVACGGDGTMNTVLQAVAQSRVPFAILPCGTGNDNARELSTPTGVDTWTQAFSLALGQDRVRTIDLGRAAATGDHRWFMGVLSTGFDSSVNERANRMSWPRGRSKYLVGTIAELQSFQPIRYRVRIDDTEHAEEGMLVCVGNGSAYGGGMRVCPAARLDDGILELTWLSRVPKPTFLRVFPTVFRGTHVQHPAVHTLRGRRFMIEGPGQVAYADGERIGPLPVEVEVVPGALRVLDLRQS